MPKVPLKVFRTYIKGSMIYWTVYLNNYRITGDKTTIDSIELLNNEIEAEDVLTALKLPANALVRQGVSQPVQTAEHRWIFEADNENECYKILTQNPILKVDDGYEQQWIADVYEFDDAFEIVKSHNELVNKKYIK